MQADIIVKSVMFMLLLASFWCWLIGFYLAFMPLYILGFKGMPRRMEQYNDPSWQPYLMVAAFGAFVDIGVHQDGLVHISALTNRYVSDPREVVKAGDIVKVKVVEVDLPRKRIALTMRFGALNPA